MRYAILIYGSEAAWDALSEERGRAIGGIHQALQAELAASGELVAHSEVDVEEARVVRVTAGSPTVSEGPLDAGGSILGGYYLVDVADVARATAIAARFGEAEFAPIEVRRLGAGSSWDA